ncbi:MAG: glycosyltransferase family 2 protein [Chloroflexi bacterium]|nr:glycosyltransferase family 2 protein [Chloroflexota bacterium]
MLIEIGQICLGGIVALIELILVIQVGYLALLTCAALFAPTRTNVRVGERAHRFAILVPAHNEEQLIEQTLHSLQRLDYPKSHYAVHVVADNCNDRTAELARRCGAVAHERVDLEKRGKGYALEWLLARLWEGETNVPAGERFDAVVIIDADTDVSGNFLSVLNARLNRGERVVQAYYAVRTPDRSWGAALRFAALAVLHYLRPQGRMVLGGSAGLKGNGMMFAAAVMQAQHWTASLTEDIEFHMNLVLGGERVMFAPDAVVWAEMPDSLANAQGQNVRWERGRLQMLRRYVPTLLRQALKRHSFVLFDAAMEQLIPPTSLLVFLSVFCLAGAAIAGLSVGVVIASVLIVIHFGYVLAGLALVRAPRKVYYTLLYSPVLVLWKVWLLARVLAGLDKQGWARTTRNNEVR